MKKNKKLMLTAIAAMGIAAVGIGGMSTFAWYKVDGMVEKTSTSAVAIAVNETPDTINANLSVSYVKADGSLFAANAAPSEIIESEATTAPSLSSAGVWKTGYKQANGTFVATTTSHSDKAFAVLFTLTIAADGGTLDTTTYSLKLSIGEDLESDYQAVAYKYCNEAQDNFESASEITIDDDIAVSAEAQTFKLWVWIDGTNVGIDGAKRVFSGGEEELFTATFTQNAAV